MVIFLCCFVLQVVVKILRDEATPEVPERVKRSEIFTFFILILLLFLPAKSETRLDCNVNFAGTFRFGLFRTLGVDAAGCGQVQTGARRPFPG